MKKKILIAAIAVAAVFAAGFIALTVVAGQAQKSLVYEEVDMSRVADGVYAGQAEALPVSVRVEVAVRDHKIQRIEILEHVNGLGGKAEAITGDMLARNSCEVDGVAGATLSSKAIKSVVSLALKEGETA